VLLREGLDLSPTGALRRMASVHGLVHDDATTRGELIERLAERLVLDSTYLEDQLDRLSDDERETLLAARASGGELRGLLVERDHPGAGDALIERGFLFRVFAAAGPLRGEVFQAPEEILGRLPPPPALDAPPAGEAPPAERRASDPSFSLFAVVSALTRTGGNLEQDVRDWSEEPSGWDWEARWLFLRHLAQSAGLLVHQADGAIGAGPTLSRLLDDPPALADRLWRTYLGDRGWSELDHAETDFEHGQELAETVLLRSALVDAVQSLPEGAWIAFSRFSDWLRRVRPVVVREQLNARGIVAMDSASWADLEEPLLRYAVLGPMYWLGVISASADGRSIMRRSGVLPAPRDPPAAFKRKGGGLEGSPPVSASEPVAAEGSTPGGGQPPLAGEPSAQPGAGPSLADEPSALPSGRPLRPGEPSAQPGAGPSVARERRTLPRRPTAAAEACHWEGAAELVAPTRANLGTLLEAERYLVLRERGRPSRYHLIQSHVAAALGGGGSVAECRRLLRKLTQAPLPDTVEDRLAAWEQRFGAVAVRPAVLVEARSPTELDEAITDERVRPFVRARLGPTVAEVAAADVLELAAALREGGHLPRVDAALRLASEPRRAYAGLVDEQVLEFLLVALLAFQSARPEYLGELEGSLSLLERLERQFPRERLSQLRAIAARLAGDPGANVEPRQRPSLRRKRKR